MDCVLTIGSNAPRPSPRYAAMDDAVLAHRHTHSPHGGVRMSCRSLGEGVREGQEGGF